MILVGLGANLPFSPQHNSMATCEAALAAMAEAGIRCVRRSRWFRSAPVPPSDQPWFVNGVAVVETALGPGPLLTRLHAVEKRFGRVRDGRRNMARTLDLDLLAFDDTVQCNGDVPWLPHPRMHERAFVLRPLVELAPRWRHPVLGRTAGQLLAALPPGQVVEPVEEAGRAAAELAARRPGYGRAGWQGAQRPIYNGK